MSATAIIVDDDDFFRRMFAAKLSKAVPELSLTERSEPDLSGRFDVYFIDNRFGTDEHAIALVAEARRANPQALVIALSAHLDADTLRHLINNGCNGACLKGDPHDLNRCYEIVRSFISNRPRHTGFGSALRSITELIREWNARLDKSPSTVPG